MLANMDPGMPLSRALSSRSNHFVHYGLSYGYLHGEPVLGLDHRPLCFDAPHTRYEIMIL